MNFFVLEPANGDLFGRKWAYAEQIEPIHRGDVEHCPVCGRTVSLLSWLPPHRIKLSSAKPEKWGDFVWGAFPSLLVSAKFKEIYERESLTGISEFFPAVEVVRMGTLKSGEFPLQPPVYHLIRVPWGGANQDDAASGLVHERPEKITCSYCRVGVTWRKQHRVIIEEGSWKGQDIFKPRAAPVNFMVSERFKRVVEEYALSNLWMIPSEKFAYDERGHHGWYIND
jgi:hypothetical protein